MVQTGNNAQNAQFIEYKGIANSNQKTKKLNSNYLLQAAPFAEVESLKLLRQRKCNGLDRENPLGILTDCACWGKPEGKRSEEKRREERFVTE